MYQKFKVNRIVIFLGPKDLINTLAPELERGANVKKAYQEQVKNTIQAEKQGIITFKPGGMTLMQGELDAKGNLHQVVLSDVFTPMPWLALENGFCTVQNKTLWIAVQGSLMVYDPHLALKPICLQCRDEVDNIDFFSFKNSASSVTLHDRCALAFWMQNEAEIYRWRDTKNDDELKEWGNRLAAKFGVEAMWVILELHEMHDPRDHQRLMEILGRIQQEQEAIEQLDPENKIEEIEAIKNQADLAKVCSKYNLPLVMQPTIVLSKVAEILYRKGDNKKFAVIANNHEAKLVEYANLDKLKQAAHKNKYTFLATVEPDGSGHVIRI